MNTNSLDVCMKSIMFYRIFLLLVILALFSIVGNELGNYLWFTTLTFFLILYNSFEVGRYFYRDIRKPKIYLSPTVITSSLVLVLGYGVTNILFITPWFDLLPLGVLDGKEISNEMSKLVLISLIASLGLWIGHDSKMAKYFYSKSFYDLLDRILPNTAKLRCGVLPILLLLSVGAKVTQENLEIFGYCSTYESVMASKNYSYYLTIFSNFGKLGLVISTLSLFYGFRDKAYVVWALLFWLTETAFGVVSASKTNIIVPTLMFFLCKIISSEKIKISTFAAMGITVISLYFVALPFVDQYRENVIKHQKNESGACSSFVNAGVVAVELIEPKEQSVLGESRAPKYLKAEEKYSAHDGSSVGKLLARFNYSFIGSYGLTFSDEKMGKLPNNILSDLVLSPLHAWIPRFIWESKPISNLGIFYNRKILGSDTNSSAGMGSITYLYMGGGVILVLLGYLLIGVTQQAFFSLVFTKEKMAGQIVFLMLLSSFAFIESAVNSYAVDFFRLIPMWILMTHIIFKGPNN